MTTDPHAEERIRGWLSTRASDRAPDRLLVATFEQTRQVVPRSGRRDRWRFAGRPLPITFAAGIVAMVLVGVGVSRSPNVGGAPDLPAAAVVPIAGVWPTNSKVAATIEREPGDARVLYWRAATYDQIEARGWRSSAGVSLEREARAPLVDGLADDLGGERSAPVTVTITPNGSMPFVLSPGIPVEIDRAVRLQVSGRAGYLATIDPRGDGPYTITARVSVRGDGPGQLSTAELRAAGTDYPPDLLARYTGGSSSLMGPNLRALRDEAIRTADSSAPIDVAVRLEQMLRGAAFTYDADVRDLDCGSMSVAECFATFKRGYCQYYASTMVVILRDLGIPARPVEGFLPGERDPGSAVEVVRASSAHAWVEMYVPRYGWVAFDPTGGRLARSLPPVP